METAVLVVAGWTAGVNAYLTVLLLGLAGRLGWLEVPIPLTRPWVLALFAVAFAMEFVADKMPVFDSVWDLAHTLIRPTVGAALGAAAANTPGAELGTAGAAALGGGLALVAHLSKATTRLALNVSPEPVTNMAASVSEDASVIALIALAVTYPAIASVVALIAMVLFALVAVAVLAVARRGLRLLRQQIKGARLQQVG